MSLSCGGGDYDPDGGDWWWVWHEEQGPLTTKRSRKCCSCEAKIAPHDTVSRVERYRGPLTDIEEAICGDEICLAPWFLCETCGDLALSLKELGFCFDLGGGESLQSQIREYRDMERRLSPPPR